MEKNVKWYLNKQLIYLGIFILVLILAVLASYFLGSKDGDAPEQNQTEQTIEESDCRQRRLIDNVCVGEGEENSAVWATMIENSIDARPPAGVEEASIVFEAIAEGSITRFLVIFPGDLEIDKIGPVRSARPYYVDWAEEFNPVYLHVGGSPQALAELAVSSMRDLNQFYNGGYFWRAKNRFAPHNVYTSSELINEAIEDKDWDELSTFETWKFKEDEKEENRPDSQLVTVDYGEYYYNVKWQYSSDDNTYLRLQPEKVYQTESGEEVKVKNVAVVNTTVSVIDAYGRLKTKTLGEGKAMVFLDGQAIEVTWKKPNARGRLRFFDKDDNEIAMNQGKTWINIMPNHLPGVSYE